MTTKAGYAKIKDDLDFKAKNQAGARAWYAIPANRNRASAYNHTHRFTRRTMDTYKVSRRVAETLVALRDGPGAWCDICHTSEGPFNIDHDHTKPLPQSIRGILCDRCNYSLGVMESSFPIEAAASYLRGSAT